MGMCTLAVIQAHRPCDVESKSGFEPCFPAESQKLAAWRQGWTDQAAFGEFKVSLAYPSSVYPTRHVRRRLRETAAAEECKAHELVVEGVGRAVSSRVGANHRCPVNG